jgi:hypothetical protein
MKTRIALIGMLFASVGIITNFASASPRPQSAVSSLNCSSPVSGETAYVGQIQSPTSTGSFRLLRANAGASTVVTVTYTNSVLVCQGAQQMSMNSLVPGTGVAVYGHVMISGGSSKMSAQRIQLQLTTTQASAAASGPPSAYGVAAQGPPPAENSAPPSQSNGTINSSTLQTANLHPTNVTTINTAALQTANSSNSTQTGASQQTTANASTSSQVGSTSASNSGSTFMCSLVDFKLQQNGASSATGLGNRAGASSSTSLTCGLPFDNNNLSEFISAAFSGRPLPNLTLAYGVGSASSSSVMTGGGRYVEFMLANPVVRDLQFSAQASSQNVVEVTFGFSSLQLSLKGFPTAGTGTSAAPTASWSLTTNQKQ